MRQDGRCRVRVCRLSDASRCPHAEHVFELGYQRPITIRCRPAVAALYASIWRKEPNVRLSTLACSGTGYARHLYAVLTTTKIV